MDLNDFPQDDFIMPTDEPPIDDVANKDEVTKSFEDLFDASSLCEPCVGMVFDTLEESHVFWNKYGRSMGFSTRIRSTQKSKEKSDIIVGRDYVCSREGKKTEDKRSIVSKTRSETRCGCPSIMRIRLIKDTSKFRISTFMKEHNHPLEEKLTTQYLRSHCQITNIQAEAIDVAEEVGLGPKITHRYMSLEAGGSSNVGFIPEDIKSYLRKKKKKKLKLGEANTILEYFRERKKLFPSFFHDYQYDRKGMLTNIFWVDSRMIVDYQAFGDVIMFDTTFGTNKALRPLGIFTGFNNHRECVVFGACLLFDETIPSFTWAFKVFLDSHGGKEPIVIFTDQDAAMKNALEVVMTSTRHCLCSWHILHNAGTNMGSKLQGNFPQFKKDLKACMYMNCKLEKFEETWKEMAEKYNIADEKWFIGLYNKKEQWSVAYRMNIFSAGVRSTQLVECQNGKLKKELGTGITMRKFFKGFDYFVDGVRERERMSDFRSIQSSPHVAVSHSKILKHVALVYTPRIFDLFNKQFDKMHSILLNEMNIIPDPHVRKAFDGDKIFRIVYDPLILTISCACCMFEMRGYLCAHILRVFNVCGVHAIPDKYIMKRWTRNARSGLATVDAPVLELSDAEKIVMMMSNFNRLAYRTKGHSIYVDRIMKFISEEEQFIDSNEVPNANDVTSTEPIDDRVTGLKIKESNKGHRKKRELSCLEKKKGSNIIQKKKRKSSEQSLSQDTNSQLARDDDINLCLKI